MNANVLDSVIELQRQREAAASEAYGKLVRQLASGAKAPSAGNVDAVLTAAHKTVDELAEAVKLIQRRESLRDEIRQIDTRNDDRVGLQARLESARSELQLAQDKFKEIGFPIEREIDSINQMHHRRNECERELRSIVDDVDDAALSELDRQIQQASKRKDSQIRLLRDLQSRLKSSDKGIAALAIEQVARAEESLAEMTLECEALVSQQSELLRVATFG